MSGLLLLFCPYKKCGAHCKLFWSSWRLCNCVIFFTLIEWAFSYFRVCFCLVYWASQSVSIISMCPFIPTLHITQVNRTINCFNYLQPALVLCIVCNFLLVHCDCELNSEQFMATVTNELLRHQLKFRHISVLPNKRELVIHNSDKKILFYIFKKNYVLCVVCSGESEQLRYC